MNKIFSTLKIDILALNETEVNSSWNYEYASNPFTRIYYTVSGKGYVTHRGKKYTLRPGFLHIIPGGTTIRLYCPESMRQLYIHFRAKILSGLDIFNFIEMNYEINFKDFPLIPSLADNLRPENNRQKPSLIETDGTLRLFISYFSRVNEKKDSNLPDFIKFMPALDYMEKNYNHRITLETLATTMNLQPTYFSNLFKKSFKVPPMTFLNRKRIEKAQGILLSESGNVTEAAEASGFSDVFYFSKTFRKITGVSPSEYKKYRKTIIL